MAQRNRRGVSQARSPRSLRMAALLASLVCQSEEGHAIPAGAGDGHGDGGERRIMLSLVLEAILQNFDQNRAPFPLAPEDRAGYGDPAIQWAAFAVVDDSLDAFSIHDQEIPRRNDPQVGVADDFLGAL